MQGGGAEVLGKRSVVGREEKERRIYLMLQINQAPHQIIYYFSDNSNWFKATKRQEFLCGNWVNVDPVTCIPIYTEKTVFLEQWLDALKMTNRVQVKKIIGP